MLSFADHALTVSFENELAWLTLNRPAQRNALNRAIWAALPLALQAVAEHAEAKVLIVRGQGEHFAAGADISEFQTVFADRAAARLYAAQMSATQDALASFEKPVIAMIQGYCIGAGLAIALACDLRMAAANARLGVTPAKLGMIVSLNDTRRLIDAVGPSAAKDLLFTGRLLDAPAAQQMRLVDEVHAAPDLEAAVHAKARQIAATSQWSVRTAKKVVAQIVQGTRADTDATRDWFVDAIEGEDYREGLNAFLNKRPPEFPFR